MATSPGQVAVQLTEDGTPLVPDQLPVKPKDVEAPEARLPLWAAFLTETPAPLWV